MKKKILAILSIIATSCSPSEEILEFKVLDLNTNKIVGKVLAKENNYGLSLQITINQSSFSQGLHGFHVHENSSCENKGKDAGSHFSTHKDSNHSTPWDKKGHAGDLTNIYINHKGSSESYSFAHKIKIKDIKNKALIIHENQDNYTESPKLGGSGARIGCALIQQK